MAIALTGSNYDSERLPVSELTDEEYARRIGISMREYLHLEREGLEHLLHLGTPMSMEQISALPISMMAAPPLRQRTQAANKFWQFRNSAEGEAELLLYGDISDSTWWGDEVTPKQFLADLRALGDVKNITVRINSNGGDVFAAEAIATNLQDHPAYITAKVDGICASAAVRIALACNKILISASAYMMVHKPLAGLMGYYYDHELDDISEYLGKIKEGVINAYAGRTGKEKKAIAKIMDAITWYTGEEAVNEGFADELMFQNKSDPATVIDGNRLIINGVGFDMERLPQRVVASFSALAGQRPGADTQNTGKPKGEEAKNKMTLEELRAQHPELVNQIETAANAAGATAERTRIQAIDGLADKVEPALIAEAKFTNTASTAETVAMRAVKEGKFLNTGYVKAAEADADGSGAQNVPGAAGDPAPSNNKAAQNKAELAHVGNIAKQSLAGYAPRR